MIDRFASMWALGLLLLVPLVGVAWARARARGVAFSSATLLAEVPTTWRVRLRVVVPLLMLAALALFTVALVRPQRLIGRVARAGEGIAIEIVLDRSGSMKEEIAADKNGRAITKMDAVKRLIHDFVIGDGKTLKGRPDDLIGLVTFARFADTVAPLSRSGEILVKLAEQTKLALVRGEDGTAIGEGLALGAARLRAVDQEAAGIKEGDGKIGSKVIVLMTDGQNNAGGIDPMDAAGLARQWGMKVYTIGVGAGARTQRISGLFGDLQIPMGSGVDEETLKAIAETTGGRYFAAASADALREVYRTIDALERSQVKTPESTVYEELFMPWAAAGMACALLACALRSSVFGGVA